MGLIRFRRLGSTHWEIAFNEAHLRAKLDGDLAEVIVPAKPWFVRLWRRFFPLRGVEFLSDVAQHGYYPPNEPVKAFLGPEPD